MNFARFAAVTALTAASLAASAATLPHHWSGTADANGLTLPVELDLSTPDKAGQLTGAFLNGDDRSPSSAGTLNGDHLTLRFGSFARTLEGDIHDGTLTAVYSGARSKPVTLTLHADRDGKPATTFVPAAKADGKAVTINGDWEIALPKRSSKGEDAWLLRISPYKGSGEIKAVVLRIDGDTNALYGRLDEESGTYHVTRFSDAGGSQWNFKPLPDGTLEVTSGGAHQNGSWIARRPEQARKEGLAPPTPITEQTGVLDPKEPLHFAGPNLTGTTVSSNDPEFKGKVVITAIGGSWCPNCHDEAPLLVELYRKYHSRGLEIVGLYFEEDDQLKNPERLRAFVTEYKIPYPVLLMGNTDQLHEKLPQGKNLNCWPTAFFIGRDGLVKETHAGFSGPATGLAYVQLKAETEALVEKLLADNQRASN